METSDKDKGKAKANPAEEAKEEEEISIKDYIKRYTSSDGEHYSVKIQHPKTGELRPSEPIPRVCTIESQCFEVNSMWPIQLYCGIKSAELDRQLTGKDHFNQLFSSLTQVLIGFLDNYAWLKLSDVEKILRRGDCDTYLVSRPIPKAGTVRAIIKNGAGEDCTWFYDIVFGLPCTVRAAYEEFGCESMAENMERLACAGHIVDNLKEFTAAREIFNAKVMQEKLACMEDEKFKQEKLALRKKHEK